MLFVLCLEWLRLVDVVSVSSELELEELDSLEELSCLLSIITESGCLFLLAVFVQLMTSK